MPKVKSDFPSVVIDVDVYGHKVAVDLAAWADLLILDPNNIIEQMMKVANQYFDIAQYTSCAVARAEHLKQALDIWYSEAWSELFSDAAGRGEKQPTVDNAKATVRANPEYKKRLTVYAEAQEDASMLENAREAIKMKQFMLTKLADAARAEG